MNNKTLDQILYEAYSGKVKEIFNLPDDVVIRWIDLPEELRVAWAATADSAVEWFRGDHGE